MKKILLPIIMTIPLSTFADSYRLVNFNQPTCERSANYEYSICIKNNTGVDIVNDEIFLNDSKSDNGGGDSSGPIPFSIWKANSYITIEVSDKFFTNPPPGHDSFNKIGYFLTHKTPFKRIRGCGFTWTNLTPPYLVAPIMTLERNGNDYSCHY